MPRSRISHVVRRSNQRFSSQRNREIRYVAPRARSASSGQGENEHRIMALFFFLLLRISHREQLLLVQGHQMRDLPRLREIGQAGGYPRLTSLSIKNPYPEESRSSRMSMSWIPGFILVLIHHGILEIYKNILGEGSYFSKITRC